MDTNQSVPCVPKALSCESCHKRKVKCDKVHGHCSNCTKAGIRCIVRNRKKNAKKEDARLLSRLSMLEELVQDLRNAEARNNNTINSLQNGKGRSRYVDLGQACLMRWHLLKSSSTMSQMESTNQVRLPQTRAWVEICSAEYRLMFNYLSTISMTFIRLIKREPFFGTSLHRTSIP